MKILPDVVTRCGLGKVVQFVEAGCNLHATNSKGRNALHCAARLGKSEIVDFLLAKGLKANSSDVSGEAPLQMACRYGHVDCAKALIRAGADLNHVPPVEKTQYSETALCSAVREEQLEVVMLLLREGADCNIASEVKRHPLIFAIYKRNLNIVALLLDNRADPNVAHRSGIRALHFAVDEGDMKISQILLEKGALIDATDSVGETALHIAGRNDDEVLAEYLISQGANLEIRGREFKMTPLELCFQLDCPKVKQVLIGAGAKPPAPSELLADNPQITIELTEEELKRIGNEPVEDESVADDSDDVFLGDDAPKNAVHLGVSGDANAATQTFIAEFQNEPLDFMVEYWTCSRRHVVALGTMKEPMRLERIAYVARGSRNGSEEDGPKLLGESYQEFVNRLVRENLARKLTHEEAALIVLTGEELRLKALSLGQKTSGTKTKLLSAIIASSGISAFSDLLQQRALYLQTEKAQQIVESFKINLAKLRSQWMNASFDALRVGDLKQAARFVWRFDSLANEYCAHGMFEYLHLPHAAQVMLSKNRKLADGRIRVAHAMGHLWKGEVFENWLEK